MTEKKELERVLKLGTMQEFLEMSDEEMKKATTSGERMAEMINTLWLAVRQLADERNKEAAKLDALKEEWENFGYEIKERCD